MHDFRFFDFSGPFGGSHDGPGPLLGLVFCGLLLFGMLALGFVVIRTISRRSARSLASQPARPTDDTPISAQPWPNFDSAPSAPRQSRRDKVADDQGRIEYF